MTRCSGKPYEGNNDVPSGITGKRTINAMSDTPTLLRQQLQQLEAEMRAASLWSFAGSFFQLETSMLTAERTHSLIRRRQ